MTSAYRVTADAIVVLHLAFVVFVGLGGLLAIRWRWIAWLHVPAVLWGVTIEFGGWICPLTPLENYLRQWSGAPGYEGDFVARYVIPVLYPAGLTHQSQLILGALALGINLLFYGFNVARLVLRQVKPLATERIIFDGVVSYGWAEQPSCVHGHSALSGASRRHVGGCSPSSSRS
jgi:Protein of Unknown function (DUF2784)